METSAFYLNISTQSKMAVLKPRSKITLIEALISICSSSFIEILKEKSTWYVFTMKIFELLLKPYFRKTGKFVIATKILL